MTTRTMRRGRRAALAVQRGRQTALLVLIALLGLLAGGCFDDDCRDGDGDATGPPDGDHHHNPHWQLWRLQGIHDYQYVWSERCFCRYGGYGPWLVQVRNDAVVSVWSLAGDSLLPNSQGRTIEDLFDLIETGPHADVAWHPVLGYPMHIAIVPGIPEASRSITVYRLSCDIVPPAKYCWCRSHGDACGYLFTALDSTGIPLVEGCLDLIFTGSPSLSVPETIEGTRCLNVLGTLPAPYAFLDDNPAHGGVNQFGEITIDLNARTADSNIILTGRFDHEAHGSFSGTWVYLTFHGEADRGTFTAERGY